MKSSLAVGLAGLMFTSSVLADPPGHAPAHGWHKKHDQDYVDYTGRSGEVYHEDYGVLSGRCNHDAIGAVIGGVTGAAIGSQIADPGNKTVGMVVGGVLGALIGHAIGDDMDKGDRACMGHALELGKPGVPVVWSHDGHHYKFIPRRVMENHCRNATLAVDGRPPREVLACPTRGGEWRFDKY